MSQRPSAMLGLKSDSYEAYCLDEAVIYFGLQLEAALDKAGHKPSKQDRKVTAARTRVLDLVLGTADPKKGTGFADPAAMF